MLTRLRVSGFKNLLDLDLHFGPFTCLAGVNGAGKSNLLDAVRFLGALADHPLVEAAQSVRAEGRRPGDVESLLCRGGGTTAESMSFTAELIVPGEAVDDLGRRAAPSITFLRYHLVLARRQDRATGDLGPLEVRDEELGHINLGEAYRHLPFPHRAATWRHSAVTGSRRAPFFISTEGEGAGRLVTLHQDGGGGRPWSVPALSLPRTVLSTAGAAESPTALAARREMQSWRLLRLEPSSLREPDDLRAPTSLGADGAHLAATLHHLAGGGAGRTAEPSVREGPAQPNAEATYGAVAACLADLGVDVDRIQIDADARRELLTLVVTGRDGVEREARSLSAGTLRLLALALQAADRRAPGLLCLEEPESGIHPARLPGLLRLLQEIPTDTSAALGPDNPLRQLIVTTYSPALLSGVPDDSLLVAEPRQAAFGAGSVPSIVFRCLAGTWRARLEGATSPLSRAELVEQFHPAPPTSAAAAGIEKHRRGSKRDEPQPLLPYS